jgi:hypothetical protein
MAATFIIVSELQSIAHKLEKSGRFINIKGQA